jgi:Skp family chaperone for outer membrane proteins
MKKILLTTAAVGVLGVSSIAGVGIASAYQGSGDHDSLISKIAEKFNLDASEVQQVFDEEHAAREAEMKQELKSKLDQAVSDGKLTQEQADQLFAKKQELADFRHTLADKTPEERREALKTKHQEFKQWAEDNGIDLSALKDYIGGGFGPGRGMRNNAL